MFRWRDLGSLSVLQDFHRQGRRDSLNGGNVESFLHNLKGNCSRHIKTTLQKLMQRVTLLESPSYYKLAKAAFLNTCTSKCKISFWKHHDSTNYMKFSKFGSIKQLKNNEGKVIKVRKMPIQI